MEQFIEEELDGRQPEEIEELSIDNCKAPQISGLTDKFVNLQTLSIANCELETLKGLPKLPSLRKLDLSDNRLSGGLDALTACPNLEYLGLNGNPILDVSALEPLKKLSQLQHLELYNCDIATGDDYRVKIFEVLDHVLYIDGMDRDGHTAPEEDYDDDEDGGSDEEDDEDSEGVPDEDVGDEDEDDDEDDDEPRGTKRKHEDEENADD